jgi:dihydroxyacid dehydratase/phosphogluconate dehydratase
MQQTVRLGEMLGIQWKYLGTIPSARVDRTYAAHNAAYMIVALSTSPARTAQLLTFAPAGG